ncbi:MAG: DUF2188 domain-containing protein [Streptosporangiales bacterium]
MRASPNGARPFGRCWQVRCSGEATMTVETRDAALEEARRRARKESPSRIVVHNPDGSIAEQISYQWRRPHSA